MNIVMAVHHFPPHYTSGAELRAYRTAAWLRDHGHDVCVVSASTPSQAAEYGSYKERL